MPGVPPTPGRGQGRPLGGSDLNVHEWNKPSRSEMLRVFFVTTTLETHIPVSRGLPCLRKSRALLCLPAKDRDRMSSLAQCPPQTEGPVTGTGRAPREVTYVFTVKTVQADFPQFTLRGDKTHR